MSRFYRHRLRSVVAVMLVWVLQGQSTPAAETAAVAPPEVRQRLELLKIGFETFVLKMVTLPYQEGLQKLNDKVSGALNRETAGAAKRKDLDLLLRLKSDTERLGKGQVLTAAGLPPPPTALASIYATYKLELARLQTTQQAGMASAKLRYDKGLAAVQDELTEQQKLDVALQVKQLREIVAATDEVPSSTAAGSTAAAGGVDAVLPIPSEWTYHLRDNVGRSGTMIFEANGTFMLTFLNLVTQQRGTWKMGPKPGVLIMTFTNVPLVGTEPQEMRFTGGKGHIDLPNVGIRYLHAKPAEESSGIAGLWSWHLTPETSAGGTLALYPDGRMVQKSKLEKTPQLGTWSDTDKPGVIRIAYADHPTAGSLPFDLRLTGTEGEMEVPNVGKRHVKFQGGLPSLQTQPWEDVAASLPRVEGLPAEWTFHTSADLPSSAWLRLLPKGALEWHDRKGTTTGTWKRSTEGFEVDCKGLNGPVKVHENGTADLETKDAGKDYLRVLPPPAV